MADGNINNIINDSTLTEFKTGQWYGEKCGKNLKIYADKTHIPVFMVRCGPGCSNCETFYEKCLKNSKNFDAIAQTKAIFLKYGSMSTAWSHIQMTENDTKNIGQFNGPFYCCQDMRTYAIKDSSEKIKYTVDYMAPWPRVVGYRNMGDGTIRMSKGIINESDMVLIEKNTFNMQGNKTDINYFLEQFNEHFGLNQAIEYSVTFYDYDRTILKETQQVSANMDAVPPENPTRDNYDFTGWNPDYTNVTQNLSCIAQYKKTDVSNPITKNYCFGLKKDCVLTTGDGVSFQYDYNTNSLYRVNI